MLRTLKIMEVIKAPETGSKEENPPGISAGMVFVAKLMK